MRLNAAQIDAIGDPDRRRVLDAEWGVVDAWGKVNQVRDDIIDDLMLALRQALALRQDGLDAAIREVPTIRHLRRQIQRLERVVIALAGWRAAHG